METHGAVDRAVKLIASLSIDKASQVFSKMLRNGAKIDVERAYMEDISHATGRITQECDEVVGSIIDLVGDVPFKFLFMVDIAGCYTLTDMLLRKEIGTTKEYNLYTESAVQEVGNVLASAVTNVFSSDFQINLKPAPPLVLHDFAGTVFEEYIHEMAVEKNEVLIIESVFHVVVADINCQMFVIPAGGTEKMLHYLCKGL